MISALAFDLFEESFRASGAWLSGFGLLGGAATFVAADKLLDRYIAGGGSSVSAFALLAGVTLDGIPENMALGVSLLEASGFGALALLAAIFASNLPRLWAGRWVCANKAVQGSSPSVFGRPQLYCWQPPS